MPDETTGAVTSEQTGAGGEKPQADMSEIKASLDGLRGELKSLKEERDELKKKVGTAEETLLSDSFLTWQSEKEKGSAESESSTKTRSDGKPDISTMTTEELVDYLRDHATTSAKSVQQVMDERFEKLNKGMAETLGKLDLELTCIRHPELRDGLTNASSETFKSFVKTAEQNPTWNAERVYAEMQKDVKLAKLDEVEREKRRVAEERKLVSEKGGVPPSVAEGKSLTAEEAGKMAYRAVYGNQGAEEL